jgi:hypothetical protein
MPRLPLAILGAFALSLAIVPAPARAQALSPDAKRQLLANMNHAYYSLRDQGFKGMHCGMDVDWSAFVSNFPGAQKGPQPQADTLKMLSAITATISVNSQGQAIVFTHVPDEVTASPMGATADIISKGLADGVENFFKSWSQFTMNQPFPQSPDQVDLKPTPDGYEMTQSLDPGSVTTHFNKNFAMTDMLVKTSSMSVHSTMQFQPSPAGLLLQSTTSEIFMQPAGKMPETAMNVTYATLGTLQLPQTIQISVGNTGDAFIKIALTNCTVAP